MRPEQFELFVNGEGFVKNLGCPICSGNVDEAYICVDGCFSLYSKKKNAQSKGSEIPLIKGFISKSADIPVSSKNEVKGVSYDGSDH